MNSKLRTEELENTYREYRKTDTFTNGCVLCKEEPLKLFKHWKVIVNKFPYDRIAGTHHMVVPIQHCTEVDLNQEQRNELIEIKNHELNDEYDFFMEPTHKGRSIPGHFHIHLVVIKPF